jgi:hypothetical protein
MPARIQCDYGNWVVIDIANPRAGGVKHAITGRAMLHVIAFPIEACAGNPAYGALLTSACTHKPMK